MRASLNKIHLVGYVIGVISLIALFFINIWGLDFAKDLAYNPISIATGLTLNKLVLYILNVSMLIIIFSPESGEDERIETIRNYVIIHTFIAAIPMSVILLGLLMKATSLLVFTGIVLAYYIIIFNICLYRDSAIIYMNTQQKTIFYKEANKRMKFSYLFLPTIAIIGITISKHQYQLFPILIIGMAYLSFLIKSVYMHWQK